MRVVYAIPRYGEQFISGETHGQVVRELRRLGIEVDVLSFTSREGHSGPAGWSKGFEDEDVYRHVQNRSLAMRIASRGLRPFLHYDHLLSMIEGMQQITRERSYDLLHIEGTYPLGVAAMLTQPIHKLPYVVTTTGGDMFTLPELDYGYRQHRIPRWLIGQALRHATWIRANSAMIGRMVQAEGVEPQRISVLPVSIGDACYPPTDTPLAAFRQQWRNELGQRYGWEDRPVISVVGRLFSLKAQELLIEALPAIHQRFGPTQACIIGPSRVDPTHGDYREYLERVAAECGMSAYCTFTGGIPNTEISHYLAATDILAVPSRLEGLNRVVIEAAAVGTPSVVSDGAGAAELIATYGCGLIVPRNNRAALTDALCRILESKSAQTQLRAATTDLSERLRASGVAEALVDIYHNTVLAHSKDQNHLNQ